MMTVLDGNGSFFPAAVGIAESEKTETWSWFLRLVLDALQITDGGEGVVFLSDRENGIETSIEEVFPRSCHGFCVFHIQKNVKTQFKTSINSLLFKAAKAATAMEFDENLTREGDSRRSRNVCGGHSKRKTGVCVLSFASSRPCNFQHRQVSEKVVGRGPFARPCRSLFHIHSQVEQPLREAEGHIRFHE